MKEITVTFTADFTAVIKNDEDMALLTNNSPEDVRKCVEQDMNSNTNYDQIKVRDLKVFVHEDA